MKGSRHTEEQIIAILKEGAGARTVDVCRKHGISSASFQPRACRSWKKALTVSASSLEPAIRGSRTLLPRS